jgi:hypothetical protein
MESRPDLHCNSRRRAFRGGLVGGFYERQAGMIPQGDVKRSVISSNATLVAASGNYEAVYYADGKQSGLIGE